MEISSALKYRQSRQAHWDAVAHQRDGLHSWGGAYHRRLAQVYRFLVSPGQRVLEVGCGEGDLLAAVQPALGVGVDFSPAMLARARQRHPNLQFVETDACDLSALQGAFDVIILSDLVNDLWDVQLTLDQLRRLCTARTRLVLNLYSHLWQPVLSVAQKLRLAVPLCEQNWLTVEDVRNLLNLAGFETFRNWTEVLFPLPIPLLNGFCNRFLVRAWPFNALALSNFMVARPKGISARKPEPVVSVVVPARNEAGNIPDIFARVPEMGSGTELIFVEGHSKDDTYAAIESEMARNPGRTCKLFRQSGIGKGDAVRKGYAEARGEVLMILDADLTVPPEDLPRFYDAIVSGTGEFINGVRLVYPMERQAMRTLNLIGNKFFSLVFSWMLGQPIKDTLCGTKVLWRQDYEKIAANRSYFGEFDPFGDYDLIFGAARQNLKIVDMPIRYRERTYGTTNIQRWKHGWLLLRMVAFAARRLKFI
ncbi:MAG: glycosyltransferase [Anaerolineales bacterium]|nr:glycosyltransferase [Anaerolineales bacterium]